MKWIRRTVSVLVILILFVLSAMIAVVILVDPNDYKDQIAELVSESSGRKLQINGEIKLSVFPWLGLEVDEAALENPPDFSEPNLAEIERLNIKVALLSLFALKVEIGELQLKGVRIYLQRRKDGVSNWDDLIADTAADEVEPASPEDPKKDNASSLAINELYIGGIEIENANVIWNDEKEDALTKIEFLSLSTSAIGFNKNTDFELSFALRNENPKVIAGIRINGNAGYEPLAGRLLIDDLVVESKISGSVVPGNDQDLNLTLNNCIADLNEQTLQIEQLGLHAAGLDITIGLDAKDIFSDTLTASGKFALRVDSVRKMLGLLAQPIPMTADSEVLQSLALSSTFQAGLAEISVTDLLFALDDSRLSGELSVSDLQAPTYRFALALDNIDLDRYLPPPTEEASTIAAASDEQESEAELPIPVELLRELKAVGELRIGTLQIMDLQLQEIQAGLEAGNGVVKLNPIGFGLYSGQFDGTAQIDVSGKTPVYTSEFNLESVESGPMLADFLGKRLLEGKMSAKGNITTHGEFVGVLKQHLNGALDLAFKDGALSTNARQRLRERKAELKQKLSGEAVSAAKPVGEPTKFSSITATAGIHDGVVHNDDLEVRARHLYVTGKGLFRVPDNYIDYMLTLLLSDDGAGQSDPLDELVDLPLELELRGKLEELDYVKIAQKALTKAIQARAKLELKAKKEAIQAELDAQVQAAAEKQQAEIERKKKEAEERARQKLEEKKKKLLDRLFN